MEDQTKQATIDRVIRDLLQGLNFSCDDLRIEEIKGPEGQDLILVRINSNDDCSLLLGKRGNNLKALEHLARLLVSKETDQKVPLFLDLNGFREKRNGKISELARLVAKKVQTTGKAYVLRPMSAYERRLVHLELATWIDVATESIGEEPNRRVVIKPYP